ncbi:MAG: folylpolyglutamate synthase/dihydrofolate synthase family protein [Candidatus Omnitrophota bacterium]
MSYLQVLRYLNSLVNFEKNINYSYKKNFKFKRIENFLSSIGNPQKSLRVIHVAGSKGKGSTCAFIAYILKEAGFSVGLYTSPHLNDFRERIRILKLRGDKLKNKAGDFEGMIHREALINLVKKIKPVITRYDRHSKCGPLTFFEVYTVIAFLYFKDKQVDFVVLETGLGGTLDATNAVDSLVQVITPISYEHTDKLGLTLSKIATEKAGIIKNNAKIVISAPQRAEVKKVILHKCKAVGARLQVAGKDLKNFNLKLSLLGHHQLINAACAIEAIKALSSFGVKISARVIKRGIKNTCWPGRCEIIRRDPLVVLDGAQNLESAQVLKKAVEDNFKYKKLILVLGISRDKDISGICRTLGSLADQVILTCAQTLRATKPKQMAAYFRKKIYLTQSVSEAKVLALKLAAKEDLILVTGSLFVVGEFRNVCR